MRRFVLLVSALAVWIASAPRIAGQSDRTVRIHGTALDEVRRWDNYIVQRERSGELRRRVLDRDPALPGRVVERFDQFHPGVRFWGGDIVRASEGSLARAIFGSLTPDLDVSIQPSQSVDDARRVLLRDAGATASLLRDPALVIVGTDNGEYHLAYM